jgi:hypothetical protein
MTARAQWLRTNGPTGGQVNCFVAKGGALFAGTGDGAFRSTDGGVNWVALDHAGTPTNIRALASDGTNIFAGADRAGGNQIGGVSLSTDDGATWTPVNPGSPDDRVLSLAMRGTTLYAGAGDGVYLSTNSGRNWTRAAAGLPDTYVKALCATGSDLFAGYEGEGIYRSTDNGTSWSRSDSGISRKSIYAILSSGPWLFAATYGGGIYRSSDGGSRWTAINDGLSDLYARTLATDGTTLFAGTSAGVFRTALGDTTWRAATSGLADRQIYSLHADGATLLAGTLTGLFRSSDEGARWSASTNGLVASGITKMAVDGKTLLAGTSRGLFRTTDNGAHWLEPDTAVIAGAVRGIAVENGYIYVGVGLLSGRIFRSSDNGGSWTQLDLPTMSGMQTIVAGGDQIFVTHTRGISYSSDRGATWELLDRTGAPTTVAADLATDGRYLFATFPGDGVYRWDRYSGWSPMNTGLTTLDVATLYRSDTTLYLGSRGSGAFRSTDQGVTWREIGSSPTSGYVTGFTTINGTLFALSGGHVYRVSLPAMEWTEVGEGLADAWALTLAAGEKDLFAGTDGNGVWRRPLGELGVTLSVEMPDASAGALTIAAYPNPITRSGTLRYTLEHRAAVAITLVDPLGRVVATPLDGEMQEQGEHQVAIDLEELEAGIYFCRVRTDRGDGIVRVVVGR